MRNTYSKSSGLLLLSAWSLVLLFSCSSRYRLDLYVAAGEASAPRRVKVEQTNFIPNARLSADVQAQEKIVPGENQVGVVTIGTRWSTNTDTHSEIFSFDEYWKANLILEFPQKLKTQTLELRGSSALTLLGQYHLPANERNFLPNEGTLTVDSIKEQYLFVTIDGYFVNSSDKQLAVTGQLKLKIAE